MNLKIKKIKINENNLEPLQFEPNPLPEQIFIEPVQNEERNLIVEDDKSQESESEFEYEEEEIPKQIVKKKKKKKKSPSLKEWKRIKKFNRIQLFLISFFAEDVFLKKLLMKMAKNGKEELKLLCLWLSAIVKKKVEQNDLLSSNSVREFFNKFSSTNGPEKFKKRNEENFKYAYKQFLKLDKNLYKQKLKKKLLQSPIAKISYYHYLFEDLIESREKFEMIHVESICTESLIVDKKKNNGVKAFTLKSIKNKLKNDYTMRKISAPFRFLVSQSKSAKEKFLNFLSSENNNENIYSITKTNIEKKIKDMIIKWKKEFVNKGHNFKLFYSFVKDKVENDKFKAPWTLIQVENAKKVCEDDLSSIKIKHDFSEHWELFKRCGYN
jgi:hypothetical protein